MQTQFKAVNPGYAARIAHEINAQGVTPLFNVVVDHQAPGHLHLSMPIAPSAVQQYQVVHGGVVAMLADSASGLAGVSLLPAADGVLTIEFKINMLAPGRGDRKSVV